MLESPAPSPAALPPLPLPPDKEKSVARWFRELTSRNSNPELFKQYLGHYTDSATPATWDTIQPVKRMEAAQKHRVSVVCVLPSVVAVLQSAHPAEQKPTFTA